MIFATQPCRAREKEAWAPVVSSLMLQFTRPCAYSVCGLASQGMLGEGSKWEQVSVWPGQLWVGVGWGQGGEEADLISDEGKPFPPQPWNPQSTNCNTVPATH